MADVVDTADEHAAPLLENDIAEVRRKATQMPKGEPGHCDLC